METAREFYYRKINPDKMANQIIHETIINLMEEYAQEVAKNLHKPPVSGQLIDFLKWIEDVYWDNKGIEDCVNTYLKQKSINFC